MQQFRHLPIVTLRRCITISIHAVASQYTKRNIRKLCEKRLNAAYQYYIDECQMTKQFEALDVSIVVEYTNQMLIHRSWRSTQTRKTIISMKDSNFCHIIRAHSVSSTSISTNSAYFIISL